MKLIRFNPCATKCRRHARSAPQRRGVIIVLIAVALVMLIAMVAFTVDIAYVQLVRTELRAATDAAAKAGVENLRRTQNSDSAVQACIAMAQQQTVGGRQLQLQAGDIVLGRVGQQADGSFLFSPGSTPFTAMRISPKFGPGQSNSALNLFFGGALGVPTISPDRSSVAAFTDIEVCLALDRSHSMCFDLSGVVWQYPPATPHNPDPVCYPPDPAASRWASLASAVNLFDTIAQQQNPKPRVAMVTWGSDISLQTYEGALTGQTFPAVARDVELTTTYSQIQTALAARGNNVMLGGTNMSAGIDQAAALLCEPTVRPLAGKVIVLMSDGQWNQGRDPILAAQDAQAQGIVIHTIAFLAQADQTTMQQVAAITGGRFYYAQNNNELQQAFTDLARLLPVVLTQ